MAQVFLSYSSEDVAVAADLARRLVEAGLSVWWDREIHGGADFAAEIEREIHAAGCVVVLWSASAVVSRWVRDEAAYARDEQKLVPLRIDETQPPFGFRQLQTLDFSHRRGTVDDEAFGVLRRSIERLLERPPSSAAAPESAPIASHGVTRHSTPAAQRRSPFLWLAGIVTVVTVLAIASWVLKGRVTTPLIPKVVRGEVEIQPFEASDPAESQRATTYTDAFRNRLTAMGVRNSQATPGKPSRAEFVLSGEIAHDGDKVVLTVHVDERESGSTLWSLRQEPTAGAAWESNLAGYALSCALKRRNPALGADLLSRYLYACASFLDRDFQAFYAATKAAYKVAPEDAQATAFFAVGTAGTAYVLANSRAEHRRLMDEARRLAQVALRKDPKNADAAFAMGLTYDDPAFTEQERWWRASIAAEPESGMAYGRYGNFLATTGRVREALDMLLRAAHDRPNILSVYPARLSAARGDWGQAHGLYELIRPFSPASVARSELQTLVMYGEVEEARRALSQATEDVRGPRSRCLVLLLQARQRTAYDRREFGTACGGQGDLPSLFAIAGDVDSAYREVEEQLRGDTVFELPKLFGPEMAAFRADPRFWPLITRMGFVRYWLETNQWPDFCADENVDCRAKAVEATAAAASA